MDDAKENEPVCDLIHEEDAQGKVSEIYQDIALHFEIEFVPNFFKALANNVDLLESTWNMVKVVLLEGKLSRSLKEIIFVAISKENYCDYCAAAHLAFCKLLGISDEDIDRKAMDVKSSSAKTMAIVKYAVKLTHRKDSNDDSERSRLQEMGVSESEIHEIISMASFASYANVLANAYKIPIDEQFYKILGIESAS